MSENSKIEWTDHTFNPWWGCQKVSAGCKHCYAESLDNRWKGGHWGPGSDRKPMSDKYWVQPLKWNEAAKSAGKPAKVFCASMADVFEDHPQVVQYRERLFELIMATPYLTWQLLTKRSENILRFSPRSWQDGFPENVWAGGSAENQERLKEQSEYLIHVPAIVRFLSCEPLLGPLTLPIDANDGCTFFEWVIAGGESGPHARPMHPDWVRSLRDQCHNTGTPFFFKQWGEWRQYDHWAGDNKRPLGMFKDNVFREGNIAWDHTKASVHMAKVGKKEAGRLLDGVEWNEFPRL
jgi:protein gp37